FFWYLNGGIHTGMEGENITVTCSFSVSGHTKFFCRETCEEGNILIKTTKNKDQKSRYSIEYKSKSFPSHDILYVSIKQLKKSDSGWYRCALERSFLRGSSWDFQIVVTEGEFLIHLPAGSSGF
uniref:Immunoglobulin domain-containing protein n=1 Tax=Amphiprion ocellaris TaxID=80972 RepID=A0A3Q1BYM7_AMPOC